MSRIAATDRMARLIAAIPWIADQDGASLDEIATRFDYPRHLLLDDLQEVVFFVGVPPYTPDTLIDVVIDDDMVWISYADWFARPMRLSGPEILSLLAAGEATLAFDNQDEVGPLARGLAKLRLSTGSSTDIVDIGLGTAPTSTLPTLREASDARQCVDVVYHSFSANESTQRRIEPARFFLDAGRWYVGGFCHLAGAERVFRLDRIEQVEATEVPFSREPTPSDDDYTFGITQGQELTIDAPVERSYVFEAVPVNSMEISEDRLVVSLSVASPRWLEQLLLRLGPDAKVIEGETLIEISNAIEKVRGLYER